MIPGRAILGLATVGVGLTLAAAYQFATTTRAFWAIVTVGNAAVVVVLTVAYRKGNR